MDRRPIRQLDANLANRIAAGEVIERPASVVKELVENAIDAGATRIEVEIADGGRELIRVTDDGGGIPPDELPLAFAAHATSKILSDDDLFAIRTMGFRGEALASIGSVAHVTILSRTPGSDAAWSIRNEGGNLGDAQAASAAVGTTVEVRHLFFNVPARRKFLRGTGTEGGHVSDAMLRLALPHPRVAFKLISSGRTTLDLPADTDERRWLAGWPESFAEQRLPLNASDVEISVRGLVGLPELASPVLKNQHIYVNGRAIRDKSIAHALREAYRGLTEPGRHPAAVLLITLPPDAVDVNVHPTKSEVRFKDSGRIHGLVLGAVRERLLGSDLTPRAQPRPEFFTPSTLAARTELSELPRTTMQEQLAEFFRRPPPAPLPPLGFAESPQPPAMAEAQAAAPESAKRDFAPSSALSSALGPRAAIQLHNSYLVAESDEGLVIIDQHALHERILFEQLLRQVTAAPLEGQRMLIPITLPATPQQTELLDGLAPLLHRLGIEASTFGPTSIALQSFPTFLEKLDPAAFMTALLERAERQPHGLAEEELLHNVLDMMSCKAAVKAGDPLTPAEIEALLSQRHLTDRVSNCPHGRPTTLRLTLGDLEKQFKRTGF